MTAAFATLAFLAAAWLSVVLLGRTLEESLVRIRAALHGQQPFDAAEAAIAVRVSQRYPARRSQRVAARPALRAAA